MNDSLTSRADGIASVPLRRPSCYLSTSPADESSAKSVVSGALSVRDNGQQSRTPSLRRLRPHGTRFAEVERAVKLHRYMGVYFGKLRNFSLRRTQRNWRSLGVTSSRESAVASGFRPLRSLHPGRTAMPPLPQAARRTDARRMRAPPNARAAFGGGPGA